jgi:uncharacterized protein (DUF2267 family)
MGQFMSVRGYHGDPVAGALGPAGLDGRSEWTELAPAPEPGERVAARLGSEVNLRKVVLAVLCPLRGWLEGELLEAILATLPRRLAREVVDGELILLRQVRRPETADDYLATVAELLLHPPAVARTYVLAVLGTVKEALAPEARGAVAARLPRDVAAIWDEAR